MLKMWQAALRPRDFFSWLEAEPPRLLLSLLVLLLSYAAAVLSISLAVFRLTLSDSLLPILALLLTVGLLHGLFMWGVGGFLLQIPAELDSRAWEVAGWSWSPLFFLSLAALPLAYGLPFLALVAIFVGFMSWHLVNVNTALNVLVPQHVNRALLTYALVLFGAPVVTVAVGIYAIGVL